MVFEEVPRLSRRAGDWVAAGQNNASILLGRDRIDRVDSGYGSITSAGGGRGTGAIHAIVGRVGEDPSIENDAATMYMSAKTDPDAPIDTAGIGIDRRANSAITLRADCIRVSARMDLKVSIGQAYLVISSDGSVVIEGNVSLGAGAFDRMIRGDAFAKFWSTVTVPTPMGPSGPPPPIPDNVFSSTNRVK